MRTATKLLVLSFALTIFMWPQESQPAYRVLNSTSDDTVETQINEIAAQGYAVQQFILDPKFQYVIVFRRLESGKPSPTYRIFSRTVSDGKNFKPPSTIEQPLSDVAAGGYRIVTRSAALRGQQLLFLLKQDPARWQYRLTHTKGNDLDRELAELGREGFQPIEYLPAKPFRVLLCEKQIGADEKWFTFRTAGTTTPDDLKKKLIELGMAGYRATVVSDDFEVVAQGGNTPSRDATVILDGRATELNTTLNSATGKKLRLLPPLASNYDRRGLLRGMFHTVGGVFERSEQDYEYRLLQVTDMNRFSRDLNQMHSEGWELRDLFTHWDPSDKARMLAVLERPTASTTK